jgi:DNA polymerase III delta subunit
VPKIPPAELTTALADGVPPLAVIAGPEEFLRREALETIRDRAGDAAALERRTERAPAEGDLVALFDDLRTPSLFGGSRIVVVDPAEKWLALDPEPWELALARPWSAATLVLVAEAIDGRTRLAKALAKRALWVQVERPFHRPPPWQPNAKPWENDVNRWTVARARRLGLAIDPPTAHLLQSRSGVRLADIAGALDRLATVLAPTGEKRISAELVAAHTPEGEDASLFEVVDALFLGDRAGALRLARELLRRGSSDEKGARSVDPTGLLLQCLGAALSRARQLRAWHECRARGASDDEAAAEVGVARPFIPRLRQQAAATTPQAIERTIDRLVRADCDLKSGAGPNAEELLERIAAGV